MLSNAADPLAALRALASPRDLHTLLYLQLCRTIKLGPPSDATAGITPRRLLSVAQQAAQVGIVPVATPVAMRECLAQVEEEDLDGEELLSMPTTTEQWGECEPNLRTFDGWPEVDWAEVAAEGYEAIPENARTYLEYISDELETPIYAVGVGPGREETVIVENPYE